MTNATCLEVALTDTMFADIMLRELAREMILQSNATVDEVRFEEAVVAGKGNWVDIAILYDMIELARNMKRESLRLKMISSFSH